MYSVADKKRQIDRLRQTDRCTEEGSSEMATLPRDVDSEVFEGGNERFAFGEQRFLRAFELSLHRLDDVALRFALRLRDQRIRLDHARFEQSYFLVGGFQRNLDIDGESDRLR